MSANPTTVELFISEKVAAVTECNVSDLREEFPLSEDWVTGFGLKVIFNDQPKAEMRSFALQLVRRSEMTLVNYAHGREALQSLISGNRNRWSPYYRALSYFETSIAHLYQAWVHMHKLLGTHLFEKNDGTPLQRLNHVYNVSKHETPTADETVWITNAGLVTTDASISFNEIEDLMRVCARIAVRLTTTN